MQQGIGFFDALLASRGWVTDQKAKNKGLVVAAYARSIERRFPPPPPPKVLSACFAAGFCFAFWRSASSRLRLD